MITFYLINLDRSLDRLQWISRRLGQLNIELHRIAAIDGKTLSAQQLQRSELAWEKSFGLGKSELACFLSHRVIWQKMVDGNEPWAFIAEDDIHIADQLPRFLANATWIPEDADVVKAETVKQRVWLSSTPSKTYGEHQLWRLKSFHGGSAGYFVSLHGATKLLATTENYCMSPDQVIFNPNFAPARSLTTYQIVPALVAQDWVVETPVSEPKIKSLILEERNQTHVKTRTKNKTLSGYVWYKLSNPFRKAGKRGLEASANLLRTHRVTKIAFQGDSTLEAA
jgi:glycosyl transferase, family 25